MAEDGCEGLQPRTRVPGGPERTGGGGGGGAVQENVQVFMH